MPWGRGMKELIDRESGRRYYPSDHPGDYEGLDGGGAESLKKG